MTNSPATSRELGIATTSAVRRKKVRAAQALFAGAATVATLALAGATSPPRADTAVASASVSVTGGHIIAVDDDNGNSVNDQGQTSGDIFTQNAQDQSTA